MDRETPPNAYAIRTNTRLHLSLLAMNPGLNRRGRNHLTRTRGVLLVLVCIHLHCLLIKSALSQVLVLKIQQLGGSSGQASYKPVDVQSLSLPRVLPRAYGFLQFCSHSRKVHKSRLVLSSIKNIPFWTKGWESSAFCFLDCLSLAGYD